MAVGVQAHTYPDAKSNPSKCRPTPPPRLVGIHRCNPSVPSHSLLAVSLSAAAPLLIPSSPRPGLHMTTLMSPVQNPFDQSGRGKPKPLSTQQINQGKSTIRSTVSDGWERPSSPVVWIVSHFRISCSLQAMFLETSNSIIASFEHRSVQSRLSSTTNINGHDPSTDLVGHDTEKYRCPTNRPCVRRGRTATPAPRTRPAPPERWRTPPRAPAPA